MFITYLMECTYLCLWVCLYTYVYIRVFQISNKIHYKYYAVLMCSAHCDRMDSSPPVSSVHGIFQARILEWVAISCSRGFSRCRDQTCISCISCIGRQILYHCTTGESHSTYTIYNMPMTIVLQVLIRSF